MNYLALTEAQGKLVESLSTEHYRSELRLLDFTSKWIAYGYLIRKDTGEYLVDYVRIEAANSEEAFSVALSGLKEKAGKISKPIDWQNPDRVRMLLNQQVMFELEWRELVISTNNCLVESSYSEDDFFGFSQRASALIHRHTLGVFSTLSDFSEEELLALVGPEVTRVYQLKDEEDGFREDAKYNLYDYILHPSEAVKRAHEEFKLKFMDI
ncbi:hypothetical protein [Motilimonas sp. E26]|uniref:hypothetical protein n=1 Tax=Motilimonas sp. E26 TaxID=2865674 RepID=UPI001E39B64F|nr:hypothetical protein [Motilimonas sp. E26]MCE0559402.1 hypothetical protein [Motilimonas sp. E26]